MVERSSARETTAIAPSQGVEKATKLPFAARNWHKTKSIGRLCGRK